MQTPNVILTLKEKVGVARTQHVKERKRETESAIKNRREGESALTR